MATIAVWDLITFFASVVISLGIGLFFAISGRHKLSMDEYFLAGRNLHYFPVAISLIVSFQSSVLMMGVPAEVYIYGISHVLTLLGDLPCMLLLNVISVPVFYKLRLTSIYQYVQRRFPGDSELLRLYLVFLGMLFTVIYSALVLLGPAYAIETLTDFPVWASIVCSAVVAVVYTTIGGMKAVIWTDVFQFFIMLIGMLVVFIKSTVYVGGLQKVFQISGEYGRLNAFNFNPNPWIRHSFWSLLIGSFFRQMLLLFSQQTMQRLNSTRSPPDARKVVFIFIPFVAALQLIADGSGLSAFAYYATKGCDPLASSKITNPNQIFIVLLIDLFERVPGMTGLVTAAILSASLSTLSSTLNGLAANTCEEFKKIKNVHESTKNVIAKLSVVGFGILATLLALAMTFVKGSLSQIFISILGSVGAPMVGMFLLALFSRRMSPRSVLLGGLVGLGMSMWLSAGYSFSTSLPQTPWLEPGPTDRCVQPANSYTNITFLTHDSVNKSEAIGELTSTPVFTSPIDELNLNVSGTTKSYSGTSAGPEPVEGLDKLYSISYQYFSVISTLVTIIVGCVANLCFKQGVQTADTRTTISCTQLFCRGRRQKSRRYIYKLPKTGV